MQQGFFSVQQTCPHCRGTGKMITDPCGTCQGEGWVRKENTLKVKVPAGVDNGNRIRLSNEGEAGRTVDRLVIFMSRFTSSNTRFLSVTATTSTARYRSLSPPPRWVENWKCLRWTTALI